MKFSGFNKDSYVKYSVSISFLLLLLIPAALFYSFQKSIFYYQENNSLFIFSVEYLKKFIFKPGGLLQYSGLFLTQGYFSPFYGSIAISVVFALLGKVFTMIQKQLSVEKSELSVLIIIPSCLLMILQRRYDHLMEFNLGFLLTGLWFLFQIKLNKKYRALTPLLFPLFYYLAGSFAIIYLCMHVVYSIVYEKGSARLVIPASLIMSALITFMIFKEFLFLQPAKLIIINSLQKYYSSGLPVLFVLLSGYIILFPIIIRVILGIKIPAGIIYITVFFIFSITAFRLVKSEDPVMEDIVDLEQMVKNQDWTGVIIHHETTPSASITGQYYYNVALSETDQLCHRLFIGRQDFGAGALKPPEYEKDIDREIYYYFATGLINEAHHLAVESMIKNGYRPETMKFIIKTEIIRGNYKVAGRFINILRRTLHYRDWAVRYGMMISDTSLIGSDAELSRKICLLPKNDFFIKPVDSLNIQSLLINNHENRVAFEYRMARLLFEKDMKTIAREVERMEEFGYTYMPGYIGEAVVEARYRNHEETRAGGLFTTETESRFRQYLEDYNNSKGKSSFENEMKSKWGHTYWFYYDFR